MGHARPDPISLPFLRESGLDAVDADRQTNGASHAGGPALAQPQYETSGAPQHLQTLRYRKRLLFGVARPEYDLFVGTVRGRYGGSDRSPKQQIPSACGSDRPQAGSKTA